MGERLMGERLTLAWLKRNAEQYTWELCEAPYDPKASAFLRRVGAELVDGNYVRRVTKLQTNSFKLGNSWMDWPKAIEVRIGVYPDGQITVTFTPADGGTFRYRLRPIRSATPVAAQEKENENG